MSTIGDQNPTSHFIHPVGVHQLGRPRTQLGNLLARSGGSWDDGAGAWRFDDPALAERAESALDAYFDQTLVVDPHAERVRAGLNALGGRPVWGPNHVVGYAFATPERANEARALIEPTTYPHQPLQDAIRIAHAIVPDDQHQAVFGFTASPEEVVARLQPGAAPETRITAHAAGEILRRAQPILLDLGVSARHAKNVERLDTIYRAASDTVHADLKLDTDPIAVAIALRAATPAAIARGTNPSQTTIDDSHGFIRDVAATLEERGGQRLLHTDGTPVWEFPTHEAAANALAIVYQGSLVRQNAGRGLVIAHEILPEEERQALFGAELTQDMLRERLSPAAPVATRITRLEAAELLGRASNTLQELGVSPNYELNLKRFNTVVTSMPADELQTILGFDPAVNVDAREALEGDYVATAIALRSVTPRARDLHINFDAIEAEHLREMQRAIADGISREDLGLNEADYEGILHEIADRRARNAARGAAALPPIANTNFEHQDRPQSSGAYIDDSRERKTALREIDGEARLRALTTLREVLDMENVPLGSELHPEPGDVIHGYLIAADTARGKDGRGEVLGVRVTGIVRQDHSLIGSVPNVPEHSKVYETPTFVRIVRPTIDTPEGQKQPNDIKVAIERDGDAFVLTGTRSETRYADSASALTALREIADRCRASAGAIGKHAERISHMILPVTAMANEQFRNENVERATAKAHGHPLTFICQNDGQLAVLYGHQDIPSVSLPDVTAQDLPVPKWSEQTLAQDYLKALAIAQMYGAAHIDAMSMNAVARAREKGTEIPKWAHLEPVDSNSAEVRKNLHLLPETNKELERFEVMAETDLHAAVVFFRNDRRGLQYSVIEKFASTADLHVGGVYDLKTDSGIISIEPADISRSQAQARTRGTMPSARVSEAYLLGVASGETLANAPGLALESSTIQAEMADLLVASREALARHEGRADLAAKQKTYDLDASAGQALMSKLEDGQTITGDVIYTERNFMGRGAQVLAVELDGQSRLLPIDMRRCPDAARWDYLDRVQLQRNAETHRVETLAHHSREERIEKLLDTMQHDVAKTYGLAANSVLVVPPAVPSPNEHYRSTSKTGDVFAIDHATQQVVIFDGTSITPFDYELCEQSVSVGDKVKIGYAEGKTQIFERTPASDRNLADGKTIAGDIEQHNKTQHDAIAASISSGGIAV